MGKQIQVGGLPVGGGAPVSIQSMTNTPTHDVEATVAQIRRLAAAGCQIVRVAVPNLAAAKAVGKARGAGTVDVYVSAPDGIPSEKLLTELQTVFQKSREIAVNVQVKAPTAATVNVAVTVKTAEGTDFANVKTAVEADLAEQFNGKLLGRGVKLAELNSRIYALPGVENCHITAPAADLAANDTVLPVLGTVTVTEEA